MINVNTREMNGGRNQDRRRPTVEDPASWRWQARTTAFAIVIAIAFGVLAIWAVLTLIDSYEERHGIESRNASFRGYART